MNKTRAMWTLVTVCSIGAVAACSSSSSGGGTGSGIDSGGGSGSSSGGSSGGGSGGSGSGGSSGSSSGGGSGSSSGGSGGGSSSGSSSGGACLTCAQSYTSDLTTSPCTQNPCVGAASNAYGALYSCGGSGNCKSACSGDCPLSSTCIACLMKSDASGGCGTEYATCQSN